MADALLLIPFNGELLALDLDEYMRAAARGRELVPQVSRGTTAELDRIVTAEQAEELTSVPASWFLEQARKGEIPHLKFGKYPRFEMNRLREYLAVRAKGNESKPQSTAAQAVTTLKRVAGQTHGRRG